MFASHSSNALAPSAEHAPSFYAATLNEQISAPALDAGRVADVCVIGGGFAGISTALHCAKQGLRTVLLEQSRLGWGASGRNGGQAHVGLRRDQDWLEQRVGLDDAKRLWRLALDARANLDAMIDTYSIRCDYRPGLLHADHKTRYSADTKRYVEHLNSVYGYESIRFLDREQVRAIVASEDYVSGSLDTHGGHLHPLNYVLGLARAAQSHGAELFERSEVTAVTREGGGWAVSTARARLKAGKVVLACNGYLRGISDDVERHVMPINNFIAVTEPLGEAGARAIISNGCAVADSRFVVNYFRMTPDHRLLFGGGENYRYRFPADIKSFVRKHLRKVFPQLGGVKLDYGWGGTLAITPTRMPYIRELQPGFINLSGFSGLGVLLAPYCGKIVAAAIGGDRAAFDTFARVPVPSFPGGPALRWPTLVAAMSLYALRDRL